MTLRRWIRHCQIALVTVVVLGAAAAACGLLWMNEKGFGGEWGKRIQDELERHGIHADFASVRLSPLRGVIARDVTVYFDASRKDIFAEIPRLRIDLDRARALRGDLYLRGLNLYESTLRIPLGSERAGPRRAIFEELTGHVAIDRHGRLVLERATGRLVLEHATERVGGLPFRMEAEFDGFDLAALTGGRRDAPRDRHDEFLDAVYGEVALWSFPDTSPPLLDLRLNGSLRQPGGIRTEFSLEAAELGRRDYAMEDVFLAGEFNGRTLTLDRVAFSDGAGQLRACADYDVARKSGRYEVNSTVHVDRLLRRCFDLNLLDDLVSARAPTLEATGDFQFQHGEPPSIGAVGTIALPRFRFLGSPFEGLETEFSWQDGDIFLRDLHVAHADGALTGQVLIQGDLIRYTADSTLPVIVYRPFFRQNGGLDRTISRGEFRADSTIRIRAEGSIQRSNLKNWSASGTAEARRFTYRGVPLARAAANFSLNELEAIYTGVEATFDYRDYPARRRHGGAAEGEVFADRIAWDNAAKLTRITNLRGTAWPGPVLALFAPRIAAGIEKDYRFRQPPSFTTGGVVDARPSGTRTEVVTRLRTDGILDYTFLGENLALENPSAVIHTGHEDGHPEVKVTDLAARVFGGPIAGEVTVRLRPGKPAAYSGGIRWTRLRLRDIGETYGFGQAEQGFVTGRFVEFSGVANDIRTLDGHGNAGLERGDLFYVPVLGPLSPIFGEVLGDKRITHEQARDASATFAVQDGVMFTRDFLASTPSTVFTGEGRINLRDQSIDMIVRMNARGLLGIITLPLRPFNGLFQFHGQGPLKRPVWTNAPFTEPARGKNDPIFRKPPKAQVVEER